MESVSNIANRLFRRVEPSAAPDDRIATNPQAPIAGPDARGACDPQTPRHIISRAFCAIDCPGRCPLVLELQDGELAKVRGDESAPACHRGLSMRAWANSPDRLMWPMRRVGPRGSGLFERITWDEALNTVAGELARVRRGFGNDAIYLAYSTGQSCTTADPFERLLNCFGGFLDHYNNYSNPQVNAMARAMYGEGALYPGGSDLDAAADAELLLVFGASPAETGTGRATWHGAWDRVCKRMAEHGGRIIVVDPRRNGSIREAERAFADAASVAGNQAAPQAGVTWLPINPGADGALVAALLHELALTHNALAWDFLRESCIGFTDGTLPVRWRGKGLSVMDYLQGSGYDHVEKTPAWAACITGLDEAAIRNLANELARTRPAFIMQGWGPQRRSNGEMTSGMVMLLASALGQIGLPGTSNGMNVAWGGGFLTHVPAGRNNVPFRIPAYRFLDAVEDGTRLGAAEGVRGLADGRRLPSSIKAIVCHGGNCLTNQHGDVNRAHRVLADPAKCEFIVNIDVEFTDSARYADIVLPDLFRMEQVSVMDAGTWGRRIVAADGALGPRFERRSAWDMCCDLAKRWGIEAAFTEGITEAEWARTLYEADRERAAKTDGQSAFESRRPPEGTQAAHQTQGPSECAPKDASACTLPPFDQLLEQGVCFRDNTAGAPFAALSDWRRDPAEHPLDTPSGKVEIFSEHLAAVAESLRGTPDEGAITPIPTYVPEWSAAEFGVDCACDQALRVFGFHSVARIHSSWGNVLAMPKRPRQAISINPVDAAARGIRTGDLVEAANRFGALRLPAEVTDDVVAGTIVMPQGAWWKADPAAFAAKTPGNPTRKSAAAAAPRPVDVGGCINTLTSSRPSPLAFGNPQHTCWCRVKRVG